MLVKVESSLLGVVAAAWLLAGAYQLSAWDCAGAVVALGLAWLWGRVNAR